MVVSCAALVESLLDGKKVALVHGCLGVGRPRRERKGNLHVPREQSLPLEDEGADKGTEEDAEEDVSVVVHGELFFLTFRVSFAVG